MTKHTTAKAKAAVEAPWGMCPMPLKLHKYFKSLSSSVKFLDLNIRKAMLKPLEPGLHLKENHIFKKSYFLLHFPKAASKIYLHFFFLGKILIWNLFFGYFHFFF